MIYLIAQLSIWLALTAAFAALAGWAWAAERDRPARRALETERERLLRELARAVGGEGDADDGSTQREAEAAQRLVAVRDGRIAELERLLDAARTRADEVAGRLAELERAPRASEMTDELDRLRTLVSQHERERAREVEVIADAAPDAEALSAWRLRYFEQRVKYLEGLPRGASGPAQPLLEWRMREAEARAQHLEHELRATSVSQREAAPEMSAFAAIIETDALLRWRTLYLEKRAQYAREEAARRVSTDQSELNEKADRWKWRARYLESRVRYLEQARPTASVMTAAIAPQPSGRPVEAAAGRPVRRAKPPILSGPRNGAPDDLTLIEGVSSLQRSTLYSLGVFHFDQIAAWTTEHVGWVDQYLRLDGRIDAEEWVEQATELAREGVAAARRVLHEDA